MIGTLVDLIRHHAQRAPEDLAYSFLVDGESKRKSLTFAHLEREACRVASLVADRVAPGSRVALIYPPGLDFLAAYFGCLFAGVIAVPVYPPAYPRLEGLPRLLHILQNSGSEAVLSCSQLHGLSAVRERLGDPLCILTDDVSLGDASAWRDPGVKSHDIAFLQYTSGSTTDPKGAVMRHANLLANLRSMHWFLGQPTRGSMVSWLPMYHDMGLIGTAMYPLSQGFPCHLLSPLHFLQRPARWLRLISDVRCTISGGPNFAYDLCVDRVAEQELATLDLSCWEVAFNGSEPIRANTVRRFESYFGRTGFRAGHLVGCYGLAETSLLATGAHRHRGPRFLNVDRDQLMQGRMKQPASPESEFVEVVSSGSAPPEQEVRIVDPVTRMPLNEGEVGEIWLHGPSTAHGYWKDEENTKEIFGAMLASENGASRSYLRTGDLGVLHDSELFVTGRLKDLLIVRGRNFHPQDIEETAQQLDPRLRPRRGVAFAVETAEGESIGLIQETTTKEQQELEYLARDVRQTVLEQMQVVLAVIYFVAPRSVLMTSSGKLRRQATRAALASGGIHVLFEDKVFELQNR